MTNHAAAVLHSPPPRRPHRRHRAQLRRAGPDAPGLGHGPRALPDGPGARAGRRTPCGDARGFIDAHRSESTILYLENAEQSPTAIVRALHRLRWAGWFDGLAGVLVGRSAAPDSTAADELRYEAALRSVLGSLPCPVLIDVDIGHRPPQMVLINAALADVHFSADQGATLTQRLA